MWGAAGPASCGVRRTELNCFAAPVSAMSEAERQATEDMFVAEAIERSLSDRAAASPAAAAAAVGPPAQPHAQPAASAPASAAAASVAGAALWIGQEVLADGCWLTAR